MMDPLLITVLITGFGPDDFVTSLVFRMRKKSAALQKHVAAFCDTIVGGVVNVIKFTRHGNAIAPLNIGSERWSPMAVVTIDQ